MILDNSNLITSLSSSCALYLSLRFFSASLIACCLDFEEDLYFLLYFSLYLVVAAFENVVQLY